MRPPCPGLRSAGLFCAALLTALAGILVVPVAAASAGTTILCKGFAQCTRLGYGNAGYDRVYTQMWWRMYGGHNCTNYAAYRMVQAGMSAERPWSGSGNASNWGVALASRVDQTPTVRSIAWWKNRNHVQVVERVLGPGHIIVSEDHYGGDFDWAEVRRNADGSNWPDGFIHLRDAQVRNTAAPAVVGTPQVEVPLTVDPGSWDPSGRIAVQWLRNGVPIAGATGTSFSPRGMDRGQVLSAQVTANKISYLPETMVAATKTRVAPGVLEVLQPPAISGYVKVGATVAAKAPLLDHPPDSVTVQWYADGTAIPGATQWNLPVGEALFGRKLTAEVTAWRRGYLAVVTNSATTAPVLPERILALRRPSVTGPPLVGDALRIDPGQVNLTDASFSVQWFRDGMLLAQQGLTYQPTTQDVGRRISAAVTYRRPGYDPVTWTPTSSHAVRALPRISLSSRTRGEVAVRVRADGVRTVRGTLLLVADGRAHRVELRDGVAVFSGPWLRPGPQQVRAVYSGSFLVSGGESTVRLFVQG